MEKSLKDNKLIQQIGFGLTAAALIGSYCICAGAALNQGLLSVLLCSVVCVFVSPKLKNGVFAPDAFLLVPLFYIFTVSSPVSGCISTLLGALMFLGLKKAFKDFKVPEPIIAGASLSLAIGATILLTNHYFGIGATAETPLQMLKCFRALGFHPNFRGLFYGTITLFAMITYPFKFRKLNKYIPASFITLLIPFILNLFLNPQKELTTINEADFLSVCEGLKNMAGFFNDFSATEIPAILKNAMAVGVILYCYSSFEEAEKSNPAFIANALSGGLSAFPVRKFSIRGYGIIAAIVALTVIALPVLFFPQMFSRIPMHCVGSMLIVSAWQSVPFKSVAKVFRKKDIFYTIIFALCSVLFVITNVFTAVIIYLIIMLICNKRTPLPKERSGVNGN